MSVVALTGGSGVVGGAVLRHLIEAGHDVRVLSRNQEFSDAAAAMGATPVPGDLFDGSVARLCEGAEHVFHVAGVNQMCVKDPSEMERVNVDGTKLLLDAAERAGVRRAVVTSSAAALGEGKGEVGSEETAHRGWFLSHYERTKTMQEHVALDWPGDLDVVCVSPSSVQGPGRDTGTGALLLKAVSGGLPALPNVQISIVDIDDCAAGHLLAAEHGVAGERYVLNGFTISTKHAMELLGRVTGTVPKTRILPAGLVSGLSRAVRGVERFVALPEPLCAEMMGTMAFGHRYDGSRATRDLGLTYRSAESTLRRFVHWATTTGAL